jgi:uncharacterized membrane protein
MHGKLRVFRITVYLCYQRVMMSVLWCMSNFLKNKQVFHKYRLNSALWTFSDLSNFLILGSNKNELLLAHYNVSNNCNIHFIFRKNGIERFA